MISPQQIHDLVRKNNYREAYNEALKMENEIGAVSVSFIQSRVLSSFTAIMYLLFSNPGLGLAKFISSKLVRAKNLKWAEANAILWGVYWQNMRKALCYNLFTMSHAENENTFLSSVAFVFYTEAFFGNILALAAMNKLVYSSRVEKSGLKQNFLVWLGVAHQMNANSKGCIKSHKMFNHLVKEPDPFQLLISKASILNMSISEMGPLEAETALEECFKVSCSLNNSRNHIQLYGAKTILLALDGNLQSASSFYEKAKLAAHVNDNTLDWIIFSRLSCIYFLIIQDWNEFDRWHSEMSTRLNDYAPVGWYWKEFRRLEIVAIQLKAQGRITPQLLFSMIGSHFVVQPIFLMRELQRTIGFLATGKMGYWSQGALLKYYSNLRSRSLDSANNEKLKALILSLSSLMTDKGNSDLKSSIRDLGQYMGADLVLVEEDLETVVKNASNILNSHLENNLTKDNENDVRYFIDNKGFFVAHRIEGKSEIKPFAFGMLFRVLDVHTLEAFDLISNLSIRYLTAIESIKQSADLLAQTKVLSEKAEMAAQVSHDIRSPLSALNMVSNSLSGLPEEKRLMLRNATQRINDIANQLLMKSKESKSTGNVGMRVELLSGIVDVLVSEKRIQYRDKLHVNIEADLNESYGIFANVNLIEIKRVLSNLINNSVEAFDAEVGGTIKIGLKAANDKAVLYVQDNGKGIPKHILEKLGESRVTFGKEGTESGSGLGVYHARKTIESVGGEFKIESTINVGTTVSLIFAKQKSPQWFVEKISLKDQQTVVCIDDDVSIHQIWGKRLEEFQNNGVNLVNISSGESLQNWLNENPDLSNTLFLVDYELLGQPHTGLDLIEKFALAAKAILVTSRFEEDSIQNRCSKLEVKLIPKGLASIIPITKENSKIRYTACLIDDDPLIHSMWTFHANTNGGNVKTFYKPEDFYETLSSIDVHTPLYIDNSLANDVKGTDVAYKLHGLGFKELYLSTGSPAEDFVDYGFLKGVVGKEPNW